MAALRDQAKIFVGGRPMRIYEGEPLEDSVRTVHAVMKMWAERGGEPTVHNGVPGLKKHMNLTSTVKGLAMDHGENDLKVLARLISQVFRQTGAAVCLRHADPHNHKDPLWFVANELPENFIVIVSNVRGRSAGTAGKAPTAFDEKLFLRPGEKRLRPEEVGEDQPAGEVTVTQAQTTKRRRQLKLTDEERAAKAEEARRIFASHHDENRRKRAELKEQLLEFILTSPVPMSHPEIVQLFNEEFGTDWHGTTLNGVLHDLEKEDKISSRKETAAERLIRGGGHKVKAAGPKLWGPPNGFPERAKLPKGIAPLMSAEAHAQERKREQMGLDDRVYLAMDVPNQPGTGHGAPRTPHMIAIAADVTDREALESLERMVASGRVFHHPTVGYYSPMTRVRQSTIEKYLTQPTIPGTTAEDLAATEVPPAVKAAEARPAVPPYANHPGNEPAHVPAGEVDLEAMVTALVQQALAGGTTPAGTTDLLAENERLLAENVELRSQLAKAEAAVAGLRQALAALG